MTVRYIGTDSETGGLDPKHNPVLTAYFCALSDKLDVLDELYVKVLPSEPYTQVDAGALKVNKIDIEKHMADPESLTREQAAAKIKAFLEKHGPNNPRSKDRPKLLGHNLNFDISMFKEQLIDPKTWEANLHYHTVDTMPITEVLKYSGWLPEDLGKLESLVKFFNVERREAHNAKGDVLMTVDVYRCMTELLKNNKPGTNNSPSMNLLSMLEK